MLRHSSSRSQISLLHTACFTTTHGWNVEWYTRPGSRLLPFIETASRGSNSSDRGRNFKVQVLKQLKDENMSDHAFLKIKIDEDVRNHEMCDKNYHH